MTEQEWGRLAVLIEAAWSQPVFDEIRSASYFEFLKGYEGHRVEAAFRELLSEGREFLPSLSVVLAKLEETDDPELRFETMWMVLKTAMRRDMPERFLELEHPLYLRFYLEQGRARVLGCLDESNSYAMHAVRAAWKELTEAFARGELRERVKASLGKGPLVPAISGQQKGPRRLEAGKAAQLPLAEGADPAGPSQRW